MVDNIIKTNIPILIETRTRFKTFIAKNRFKNYSEALDYLMSKAEPDLKAIF